MRTKKCDFITFITKKYLSIYLFFTQIYQRYQKKFLLVILTYLKSLYFYFEFRKNEQTKRFRKDT